MIYCCCCARDSEVSVGSEWLVFGSESGTQVVDHLKIIDVITFPRVGPLSPLSTVSAIRIRTSP